MSQFVKSSPAPKKIIFNASQVAARLSALKAASSEEGAAWWKPAIDIEWYVPPRSSANCGWITINYIDEAGVKGRLMLRVNGEKHIGQMMPNTDAGVAEMAAANKNPMFAPKKRTMKPCIQIQKWSVPVQTAEDGVTLLKDATGNLIVPSDDKLSPYYIVASYVNEAFITEANERVERGNALYDLANKMKKENKAVTGQEILEAFNAECDAPRTMNDIIFEQARATALRKIPASGGEVLTKSTIIAPKSSIANLIQEFVSEKSTKNQGQPLPNPMTRISLAFDNDTGAAKMQIFDKSAPYIVGGHQKFDVAKIEGKPVDADNVHKFVQSRSVIDGIIVMDSICLSSMAISIPVKAEVIVVERPVQRGVDIDDVYGDLSDCYESISAMSLTRQVSSAAAAVNDDENGNYDDLLDELRE